MAKESFISPIANGSARHGDVHWFPRRSAAAGLGSAAWDRAGTGALLVGSASNWGLGGTDQGTLTRYLGGAAYQVRGGMVAMDARIPLVTTRPLNIRKWQDELWVFEVVLGYPTNAVGADNGVIWGFQDNIANLRPSVGQCWMIANNTLGDIGFVQRGPTGTDATVLFGLDAAQYNKFRVEMRNATSSTDATMQVFVNDSSTPAISKNSSEANFPPCAAGSNSVINIGVATSSATDYVMVRDWNVWMGPNTQIGM